MEYLGIAIEGEDFVMFLFRLLSERHAACCTVFYTYLR